MPHSSKHPASVNNSELSHDPTKKVLEVNQATNTREVYDICGYNNHATRDCHRMFCEIYNCNTHTTYDCVNYLP